MTTKQLLLVLCLFTLFFASVAAQDPYWGIDLISVCSGHWELRNWNDEPYWVWWRASDDSNGWVYVGIDSGLGPTSAFFETAPSLTLQVGTNPLTIDSEAADEGLPCEEEQPVRFCTGLLGLQPGPSPLPPGLPFSVFTEAGDPVPVGVNTAWDGGLDVIFCQDNWIADTTFYGYVGDEQVVVFQTGAQYPDATILWLNERRLVND